MVFGDNVRARTAARALPRTPTQRGREEERKRKRKRKRMEKTSNGNHTPITPPPFHPTPNHHRHSTMTQSCHKNTTPNQQCCDSKHKGRGNARGSETMQGARPSPNTGITAPHPRHSTRVTGQTKGDANTQTRGTASQHPPFHCYATHHRYATPPSIVAPPTTTVRGERTEDTPPNEQHIGTRTTTHHTPQQRTAHDMTAVLSSTAMG